MPFKSTYNQQEFQARKVPSSGFLNSFLKTPNVIHSRTASYQSYYGSLGKSAHCTLLFVVFVASECKLANLCGCAFSCGCVQTKRILRVTCFGCFGCSVC